MAKTTQRGKERAGTLLTLTPKSLLVPEPHSVSLSQAPSGQKQKQEQILTILLLPRLLGLASSLQ